MTDDNWRREEHIDWQLGTAAARIEWLELVLRDVAESIRDRDHDGALAMIREALR